MLLKHTIYTPGGNKPGRIEKDLWSGEKRDRGGGRGGGITGIGRRGGRGGNEEGETPKCEGEGCIHARTTPEREEDGVTTATREERDRASEGENDRERLTPSRTTYGGVPIVVGVRGRPAVCQPQAEFRARSFRKWRRRRAREMSDICLELEESRQNGGP